MHPDDAQEAIVKILFQLPRAEVTSLKVLANLSAIILHASVTAANSDGHSHVTHEDVLRAFTKDLVSILNDIKL